jgi:phosphatidylinositol dimannoside acyltransferase
VAEYEGGKGKREVPFPGIKGREMGNSPGLVRGLAHAGQLAGGGFPTRVCCGIMGVPWSLAHRPVVRVRNPRSGTGQMRFREFINSPGVVRLGVLIAQRAPRWVSYSVATCIATFLALRRPELYWIVHSNLARVLGPYADPGALHRAVYQVFRHAGQAYHDLFRAVGQPASVHRDLVQIADVALARITTQLAMGRGVLLVGPHVSSFNLGILSLAARGLPIQVLSLPHPGPGHRIVNGLLAKSGIEVTPVSAESLRAAVRRLESGGLVFTGAEYPTTETEGGELIEFFGEPALLPVGPARLCLLARVPVLVGGCSWHRRQGYAMDITGPVQTQQTGDRRVDVLDCARRIAEQVQIYVRAHPTQWLMFQRVWPGP